MSVKPARPAPDTLDLGAVKISVSDYASQGNAILGIRDSGKSYTATACAEKLLDAGIPFAAFDPIGVWRNLRNAGTGPGYELILVGENGDAEISPETTADLMRHAMSIGASIVFDLYSMALSKADWRRVVEAGVRTMLYENKGKGLRHVFIEEAAEFCPQMVTRENGSTYAEIEKLARMGGNAMLGYTLINQRAEQINKAVLELCDCLFLHRQKGRLSLTALGKWLDFGDAKQSEKIIGALPTLPQGDCYIWANGTERPVFTHIPEKRTFHPNRRMHGEPGALTPGAHLLAGYVGKRDAHPGKRLIGHLNAATGEVTKLATPTPTIIEKPVFEPGDLAKLDLLRVQLGEHLRTIDKTVADMAVIMKQADGAVKRAGAIANTPPPRPIEPKHKPAPGTGQSVGKGPRKILSALASRYPLRLSPSALSAIAGFTPSTMRTYMPRLREEAFIDENADGLSLTPLGMEFIGEDVVKMPESGEELLSFWVTKLTQGEGKILKVLFDFGGREVTTATLEEKTGFTFSTLRTYLPSLRRNNLIDPKALRIMPEFVRRR